MAKKLTIEDMQKLARSRGGECLSTVYKNAHSKLLWRCAEGHEWWAEPCNIKNQGNWCPICANNKKRAAIEDMRELARSRGGECLSTVYKNANSKLLWRCAEGHEWWAKPNNIKSRGSWCPICAGQRLTIEDMQKLARSNGGECLSTEYKDTSSKLLWRCAEGHEWWARPIHVKYQGSWCPICASKKATIEEMQELARSRGGECLSTEYKNDSSKLLWRCAEGHEWWAKPNNIKSRGSWCPICAINKRRRSSKILKKRL